MGETNVLSMPRTVGATRERSVVEEASRFLGIIIPESIAIDGGVSQELDREDIEELILDRSPFLCIDKAVILRSGEQHRILSTSVITKQMCEGHFRARTIIPLVIFSKVMALTGSILLSWMYQEEEPVPLAIRGDGVRSAIQDLITPPVLAISEVTFLRRKLQYCWVATSIWIGDKKVAEIAKLSYVLANKAYLLES